ncbi:MAG: hypothetical protein Wins2KO_30260 [Winogradskyella sp.]
MKAKTFILTILFFCFINVSLAQKREYYRHLQYNHVSPYIKLKGTYPLDAVTADNTSHYVFKYNQNNQLIEVINNHYFTERKHPLASIGVYKMKISYDKNIETRLFFNKYDEAITNDREVYKEVYHIDKNGNYSNLSFYDHDDTPMESNWGISQYKWSKHGRMIIEERFNLKNKPKNISTYFEFGITGMIFNKNGIPKATYNLNDNLDVVENSMGIASYHDIYDKYGNHITYSYHDRDDKLTLNSIDFAIVRKIYDSIGNYIKQEHYDTNNQLVRQRNIANNQYVISSPIATQQDSLEIKRISLGYLESLKDLRPALMNEVMNDSLNKVTVGYSRELRKEVVTSIPKFRMIENAKNWNKSNTKFPPKPNNTITILDIYHRIATVKLYSDNWVEYLHLIKLDGRWSIVNLLWQHRDVSRYPY